MAPSKDLTFSSVSYGEYGVWGITMTGSVVVVDNSKWEEVMVNIFITR